MVDKTTDSVGGDGTFFFGTTHKQKVFNINFAFDHMDDATLRAMKQWLNGKEMHDLWFDEEPYKVYSAKVTGTATIKHVAFEENGKWPLSYNDFAQIHNTKITNCWINIRTYSQIID